MNYSVLKKLCMIPSPSGYESKIIDYITSNRFKNFKVCKSKVHSCTIASKTKHKKTTLIDSHIDQVHLRIIRFTENGFAVAQTIGLRSNIVYGNIVSDLSNKHKGVICTLPPHLRIEQKPEIKNIPRYYVDFGMTKKQMEKEFNIGDPLVYNLHYTPLKNGSICSTGLDNKASAFVLLELLKYFDENISKLKSNIIFHFSSREEVGLGSFADTDKSNIDTIIVVDTPMSTDIPNIPENITGLINLSDGPVIGRHISNNSEIGNKLIDLAKKKKCKFQTHFSHGSGGTNANHYTKFNSAFVQDIGAPIRNMHSPVEVVNKTSLNELYNLLKYYITS
jgi:putative aminopeptidase FrvX